MKTAIGSGSRWKVIAGWGLVVGTIVFWSVFWFKRQDRAAVGPETDSAPFWVHRVVLLLFAGFGLAVGLAAYFAVIQTNCFTFDFQRPVWRDLKARIYLANIVVPTIFMIGAGLLLAAFLAPMLEAMGLSRVVARSGPIFGTFIVVQIALVWFNLWAPLEKRIITRRLAAKGITPEQLLNGHFVGLSDPTKSSLKKLTVVEDDIGMLWLDSHRLVYFGDVEHLSFTPSPSEVIAVERKVDAASTTALSGTAHLILRLRQADGSERQIRLHTEGVWTLGQKRTAMDLLAQRISVWLAERAA